MSQVRVAVVQLTCHPSFTIGGRDYASEPFLEGSEPILSRLARSMDVTPIRELCREEYHKFHDLRVANALEWIAKKWDLFSLKDPASTNPRNIEKKPVHLIVFPEGSISHDQVARIIVPFVKKASAVANNVTVLAGTHAFHNSSEFLSGYPEQLNCIEDNPFLEKDVSNGNPKNKESALPDVDTIEQSSSHTSSLSGRDRELNRILSDSGYDAKSVLPIVHHDGSVSLRLKEMPSPFERTNTVLRGRGQFTKEEKGAKKPQIFHSLHIDQAKNNEASNFPILPLVCSEALQLPDALSDARIVAILAYHNKPTDFMLLAEQARKNGKLVLVANDGAFGGSGVFITPDERAENWWFGEPKNGRLPAGDGILLVDVDLDRITPQLGLHNPHYPNGIVALAALVPGQARSVEAQISQTTNRLLRAVTSSSQSQKSGLNCEGYIARVRSMLNSPRIGPIQHLKLWRIRELLQLHNLTKERARVWCEDARIEKKRDHISFLPKDISYQAPQGEELSLRELESRLAWETIQFLEHESSIANEKGMLHDATDLVDMKRLLESRRGRTSATSPLTNVLHALSENRDEAVATAKSRLNRRLGKIVERFEGTSGWIFLVRPQNDIESPDAENGPEKPQNSNFFPVAAYNAPELFIDREVKEHGSGIVGRVAFSKMPYLANDVTHEAHAKIYLDDVPSTRSELTVPLVHEDKVLGVLNIEANYRNAFGIFDVNLVLSEATQLIADLLVLEASESAEELTQWHHVRHGWQLTPYLDSLCDAIAKALPTLHGSPSIGCSVWALDAATESVSILGTARFDFEYVAERTMEAATSHIGNAILALLKESETKGNEWKQIVRKDTGLHKALSRQSRPVSWYEECRLVSDLPGFKRKRKAHRMELRTITVFPFFVNSHDEDTPPVACAMALYGFEHEWGVRGVSLTQMFTPTVGHNLVAELSSAITNFFRQKTQIASAYLQGHLRTDPTASRNSMETVKQIFQRVFASHGCTVFVKSPQALPVDQSSEHGHLSLVATTGITPVGPNASADWKSYPLFDLAKNIYSTKRAPREMQDTITAEDSLVYHKGLTNYLGVTPGAVVRKGDAVDIEEPIFSLKDAEKSVYIAPRNSLLESFAPGASEHMRFLGASITETENSVIGVIRLTRAGTASPFNIFDEFVIREMCRSVTKVFQEKRDQMQIPFNDWPITSTASTAVNDSFRELGTAISRKYGNTFHDSLGASFTNVSNFLNAVIKSKDPLDTPVYPVLRDLMPYFSPPQKKQKNNRPRKSKADLQAIQKFLNSLNEIMLAWGESASLVESVELRRRLLLHSFVEFQNSMSLCSILEDINALCRRLVTNPDANGPADNPTVLSSIRYVQQYYSEVDSEPALDHLRVLAVQPAWTSEKPDEDFRDALPRPSHSMANGWRVIKGREGRGNPQPLSYFILSDKLPKDAFHRMHPHSLAVKSGVCMPFKVPHPHSLISCKDFEESAVQCILSVDFALSKKELTDQCIAGEILPAMALAVEKIIAVLEAGLLKTTSEVMISETDEPKVEREPPVDAIEQTQVRYNQWTTKKFIEDHEREVTDDLSIQYWKESSS